MGRPESTNGSPNRKDNRIIESSLNEHHPIKAIGRGMKKLARGGGRAASRGVKFVPGQTRRAGKDYLTGKRRKHSGRILLAGAALTVVGGVAALQQVDDVIDWGRTQYSDHMPGPDLIDMTEPGADLPSIDITIPEEMGGNEFQLDPVVEQEITNVLTPLDSLFPENVTTTFRYTPSKENTMSIEKRTISEDATAVDYQISVGIQPDDPALDAEDMKRLSYMGTLVALDDSRGGAMTTAYEDSRDERFVKPNAESREAQEHFSPGKYNVDVKPWVNGIAAVRFQPEEITAWMEGKYSSNFQQRTMAAVAQAYLDALNGAQAGLATPEGLASLQFSSVLTAKISELTS